jgi:hypothetical protein
MRGVEEEAGEKKWGKNGVGASVPGASDTTSYVYGALSYWCMRP